MQITQPQLHCLPIHLCVPAKTDDIMMILNLVISVVCIVFCWCLLTLAIKGWAKNDAWKRNEKREVALEIEGGHDRDIEN